MNRSAHCVPPGPIGYGRLMLGKEQDSERGVIMILFCFAAVIFCALAIGGIFVTSAQLAKTQTTNDVTTGAQLAAAGNLTLPQLSSCQTNVPPLSDTAGKPPDPGTLTTICEIEEVVGGTSVFVTQPGSLQVALYCNATDAAVGKSGTPCAGATEVWVCARSWDPNGYPAIISPSWISQEQEEPVTGTLAFSTFYPAKSASDQGATTLGCGTT